MPKTIDSTEAQAMLPEILRRVEVGEAFTIIHRGNPIADLIPSSASYRLKTATAIAAILKAKKRKISAAALTGLKESGRK